MRAGPLRHTIKLQSPTGSRDALGERTTTWSDVDTVRASIDPITARELVAAAQSHMEVTHKIVIRYGSEISAIDNSWRVLFGSRPFIIKGIRNINERNMMMELLCAEGLRTE